MRTGSAPLDVASLSFLRVGAPLPDTLSGIEATEWWGCRGVACNALAARRIIRSVDWNSQVGDALLGANCGFSTLNPYGGWQTHIVCKDLLFPLPDVAPFFVETHPNEMDRALPLTELVRIPLRLDLRNSLLR